MRVALATGGPSREPTGSTDDQVHEDLQCETTVLAIWILKGTIGCPKFEGNNGLTIRTTTKSTMSLTFFHHIVLYHAKDRE